MKLVISGATGRMGSALLGRLSREEGFELVGLVAKPAGATLAGLPVREKLVDALASGADVVIDFSHASVAPVHAEVCAERRVALVLGSTGLSTQERERVDGAARKVPIVHAPNMSVAVNALFQVAGELARVLGSGYDIEVLEAHHRMKKDAPSGTALRLAEVLAQARGAVSSFRMARTGQVGERTAGEIGIQALRGGDVVGDHTVYFYGDGERLEVTHRATSREGFAQGAFRAARFVHGRAPGLYDMRDVLGFRAAGNASPTPDRS
jgi:4-hydroxy-tetrahydrodipicolinate reductase